MERWEQPRVGESRGRKESQTTSVDPAFLVYQEEESKEQLLFYLGNPAASGTKLKTKAAPQSLPKPFLTAHRTSIFSKMNIKELRLETLKSLTVEFNNDQIHSSSLRYCLYTHNFKVISFKYKIKSIGGQNA